MSVAKLTQDDVQGPDEAHDLLTKLNELIAAHNNQSLEGDGATATVTVDITLSADVDARGEGCTIRIAASDGNVGFYGATPVAQQTGVAVSAAGIHAALVALGLITA